MLAPDMVTPLWRGVVVIRIVTAAFALGSIIVQHDGYARPGLGWAVAAAIIGWTVVTCLAFSYEATRRMDLIWIDLLVTLALMASSVLVLSPDQLTERAPLLTTIWACGPVLAAAMYAGRVAGLLFGAIVAAANLWIRHSVTTDVVRDAVLLLGAGYLLGLASTMARRAATKLLRAARAEAATAERERLAKSVHDGVLQVLAEVRTRGNQLGGEAGELARLAGEQETALRSLISAGSPAAAVEIREEDLAAAVRSLAGPRVTVSVPAARVLLPARDVEELVTVTREALANTTRQAGSPAQAWVQVEDLGSEVVLTVRDNDPDIDDHQPTQAEPDRRTGVFGSIRSRVADLGGTLSLQAGPDQGTEWQVRLARYAIEPDLDPA